MVHALAQLELRLHRAHRRFAAALAAVVLAPQILRVAHSLQPPLSIHRLPEVLLLAGAVLMAMRFHQTVYFHQFRCCLRRALVVAQIILA